MLGERVVFQISLSLLYSIQERLCDLAEDPEHAYEKILRFMKSFLTVERRKHTLLQGALMASASGAGGEGESATPGQQSSFRLPAGEEVLDGKRHQQPGAAARREPVPAPSSPKKPESRRSPNESFFDRVFQTAMEKFPVSPGMLAAMEKFHAETAKEEKCVDKHVDNIMCGPAAMTPRRSGGGSDAVGPARHRGSACGAEGQRGAGEVGSEHPAHKPGEQPLTIEEETELFRAQFSRRKRMKLHVVKDLNTSVSHWEITVDEFTGRMQSRFLGVALSGFLVSPILPRTG